MLQPSGENSSPLPSSFKPESSIVTSKLTDHVETHHHTRALEQLIAARVALQTATDNYITACEAIEADCNQEPTSFFDKRALEVTLVAINSELAFPAMYAQRLWNGRVTLTGLRNRSSTLLPVNLLPAKILTSIFIKAVEADRISRITLAQRAREEGGTQAIAARLRRPDMTTVISSVSTCWRKLSIQTPELWAHVDLGESGARTDPLFAKARLWLERSQGSPLYVTIATTGPAAQVINTWGILPILRSYETNLHTLDLDLNRIDEVHAALARWLNEGAPNSLTSLKISIPRVAEPGDTPHALPPGFLYREHGDEFFKPIRTLYLDGTYLSWSGPAFRNLVDLRLCRISDHVCPTVEQFVGILDGSPALCTLWLRRMTLQIGGRLEFAPVKMKNLQILGLEHIEPQGLYLLLPLLSPVPELYVRIEGYSRDPGEVGEAYTDLFARSKVEKLHFSTFVNPAQLPRMMACLEHLRDFTWQGVDIGDEFFETIGHNSTTLDGQRSYNADGNENASTRSTYLCPNLQTLDLQGCGISAAALRGLVTNRVIPKLTIAGCNISVDGTEDDAPQLMEDLEKCLNDSVPDLLLSENSLIVD
ncbi:hypothetical protein ACGC1H_003204 [Rhizoctonia solani]|uniref:F-box domain-containing protein n=1 Tax=Rhizoctonia solani TaxID=456999 RepID=A0A8H3BHD2_9AGAM|nr:unnamed protein product [Rhizoctonia solani]